MQLQIGQKVAIIKRNPTNKAMEVTGEGWVVGVGTTFAYINYETPNILCSRKEAHPYHSANSRLVKV